MQKKKHEKKHFTLFLKNNQKIFKSQNIAYQKN